MSAAGSGALLTACRLWAKTSAAGREYFVGPDDATHVLLIGEAPDRSRQADQPQPEQRQRAAPRRPQRHRYPARESAEPAGDGRPFNDDLPADWGQL
jgi:hypothetical protein